MKTYHLTSKRILLLAALSATGLVATSYASDTEVKQDKAAASLEMKSELTRSEKKFLEKAYEKNQEEIALARLAADRASSPEVRAYAKQLADEHAAVDSALQSIITQRNARLETEDITTKAQKKLNDKSGTDFDEAFLDEIVDNHKDAVDLYEDAAEDNKNPQIRTFAASTLPALRDHLARAKELERIID